MKKNYFVVLAVIILVSFSFLFSSCKNGQNIDKNDELIDVIDPKDDSTIKLNLSLDENEVLSWDEVEGASSYEIIINDKVIATIVNEADLFYEIVDSCEYKININVLYDDVNKEKDISETLKYQVPIFTDFTFKKYGHGIYLDKANIRNIKGKIIIPSRIGDYLIDSIGVRAFENCDSLTGVIFGGNITTINPFSFLDCKNLKLINCNNISKIRGGAFQGCLSLNIVFMDNLEELDGKAFENTGLKKIYIGQQLKKISSLDYYGSGNLGIDDVTISPDNTNFYIESNCLMSKNNKELIKAFDDFVIPNDTKILGEKSFLNIDKETIEIPLGVIEISSSCFEESKVKNIAIPNTVEIIGSKSFLNCRLLNRINLPSSLKEIGYGSFTGCRNLEEITIDENDKFKVINNCLIDKTKGSVVLGCKTSIIPKNDNINLISNSSFIDIGLENFEIPSNIKKIDYECFGNNEKLVELILNEGLEEIENHAFQYCFGLKRIMIPKSVKVLKGFDSNVCEIYCLTDLEINTNGELNVSNIFVKEDLQKYYPVEVKEFGFENAEYYIISITKVYNFVSKHIVPTRSGYKFLGWSLSESKEDIVSIIENIEVKIVRIEGLTGTEIGTGYYVDVYSFDKSKDYTWGDRLYAIWEKEE